MQPAEGYAITPLLIEIIKTFYADLVIAVHDYRAFNFNAANPAELIANRAQRLILSLRPRNWRTGMLREPVNEMMRRGNE